MVLLLLVEGLGHRLRHLSKAIHLAVLLLWTTHVIGTRGHLVGLHYLLLTGVGRHAVHLLGCRVEMARGALVGSVGYSCHSALSVATSVLQLAH